MRNEPTTKLINAMNARIHFGEVMESVEKEKTRYIVSRRGKPKVVILSVEDYLRNVIKKPGIIAEIQSEAVESGLSEMTGEDIDKEIKAYRAARK